MLEINPLDYSNMEKGKAYSLTLIIQSKNGAKADMIPAGYYLSVPDVVVPLENLPVVLVTPPNFTQWSHDIAVASVTAPSTPMQNRITLTVELGGDNIANLDHWCILVYGKNGNAVSYKTVSGHETGRTITCVVDTNELPSGWLTVGALFYLKGNTRDGYEIHSYGRIKVDKDHPTFDKIVEGPQSGSIIEKSRNSELCIRTTMQDPGGSGTAEYRLALNGQSQERGFKERIYGYTGINHCNIIGLPNGQYSLYVTYSKDQVGNVQTRSIATNVTFQIVD